MSSFDIISDAICIGDPVMGLARYPVTLPPGRYTLGAGAIVPAGSGSPLIDLDGPYMYILDASKLEDFERVFHALGNECSYNMMEMETQHDDLQSQVGADVAFFWEHDLVGSSGEGQYCLDVSKVLPAA